VDFGGKLLAWHLAQSGRRTAVVERRWIGGSCPNIACLPSKNEIWSARIARRPRRSGLLSLAPSYSGLEDQESSYRH
jgi:pyruvate/2-oxoglutarate dehydrogenase complex dihydrolipoamide dehydrogenase (E3) component